MFKDQKIMDKLKTDLSLFSEHSKRYLPVEHTHSPAAFLTCFMIFSFPYGGIRFFFATTNHPTLNAVNICRASQTVGASIGQQYRTTAVTMLQCLDFSSTLARILNWPLMNFQFDNWQNAAHERVRGHPRGARELEHATRARAATSSPIPISSSVPNETSTSIACPFAASDWLSLSLSFSLSLSLVCSPYYTVLNANKISNIQIFQFMHKKEIGVRL